MCIPRYNLGSHSTEILQLFLRMVADGHASSVGEMLASDRSIPEVVGDWGPTGAGPIGGHGGFNRNTLESAAGGNGGDDSSVNMVDDTASYNVKSRTAFDKEQRFKDGKRKKSGNPYARAQWKIRYNEETGVQKIGDGQLMAIGGFGCGVKQLVLTVPGGTFGFCSGGSSER